MINLAKRFERVIALAVLLSSLLAVSPAHGSPVTFQFTGSVFGVSDPSDVFGTTPGDIYTLLVTYDPALLPGSDVGDFTFYETAPGETSITFSFSTPGDSFTSDNNFPVTIAVRNTPDFLETMDINDGKDSFSIHGNFDPVTTLSLVLLESLGANPLSNNDLPTTGFGSGVGADWSVSELDVDRTDVFANISGSVSAIQLVSVPEPSTFSLCLLGGFGAWSRNRAKRLRRQ